jgi:ATP-dependent RNA helicase MSS116, mitochondrial
MAFFPTARMTQYFSELMLSAGMEVMEIHSRKSQPARTRISEEFRAAKRAILFSSDVSARGVDYPDVTLVIQVPLEF